MTYQTLMTGLRLGRPNAPVLAVAADLAELFGAVVVGVAACEPMRLLYGEGSVTTELIDRRYQEAEEELKAAEAECRDALAGRARAVEWRGTTCAGVLSRYLADQARCADLVVAGLDQGGSIFDITRRLNVSDLVMQAGRPVLLAPSRAQGLRLDHVLVGWKDGREARRAVSDALPLLAKARRVTVVEIAPKDDLAQARSRVADVAAWLARHAIAAGQQALRSGGDDAGQMNAVADETHADVIVAGAYGHSRLREWVLGGVTRDLLSRAGRCVFVSH